MIFVKHGVYMDCDDNGYPKQNTVSVAPIDQMQISNPHNMGGSASEVISDNEKWETPYSTLYSSNFD